MLQNAQVRQHIHLNAQEYPHLLAIFPIGNGPSQSILTLHMGYKYVVVTSDYFTKLIESKPLATITPQVVKWLFWKNIICHFGAPREITVDTETD